MAVYVDKPTPCLWTVEWPFHFHCRLHADNRTELNRMARSLGLPFSWYQPNDIPPNYKINIKRRCKAIDMGAIPCSREKIHGICEEAKKKAAEERQVSERNYSEAELPEQAELTF